MNKELIKRYSNEFNHWLNDGEVLTYNNHHEMWHKLHPNSKWDSTETLEEDLKYNSYGYVINDEYVEFRIALAEGKHIETSFTCDAWQDITSKLIDGSMTFSKYFSYRIKPEEPEFKEGDWVVHNGNLRQVTKVVDGLIDCLDRQPAIIMKNESLGLWRPKPREWCWSLLFGLVKVICEMPEVGNHCYLCWNPWKKAEQKLNMLEPFIGTIPTFLKE